MVSIIYPIWVERKDEMRSGEWTRGMSLALTSAVEALEVKEGSSPLSILRRLKGFKPEPGTSQKLGEKAHKDDWQLCFGPADPNVFDLTVTVSLLCENHSQYGHRWCHRTVTVVQPNETRPGEYSYTYESELEKPLAFGDADHWSADN